MAILNGLQNSSTDNPFVRPLNNATTAELMDKAQTKEERLAMMKNITPEERAKLVRIASSSAYYYMGYIDDPTVVRNDPYLTDSILTHDELNGLINQTAAFWITDPRAHNDTHFSEVLPSAQILEFPQKLWSDLNLRHVMGHPIAEIGRFVRQGTIRYIEQVLNNVEADTTILMWNLEKLSKVQKIGLDLHLLIGARDILKMHGAKALIANFSDGGKLTVNSQTINGDTIVDIRGAERIFNRIIQVMGGEIYTNSDGVKWKDNVQESGFGPYASTHKDNIKIGIINGIDYHRLDSLIMRLQIALNKELLTERIKNVPKKVVQLIRDVKES